VLDDFLPAYDVNEVHSTSVDAPPEAVMEAARALTARDVPLLVALMALRAPWRMGRRSVGAPLFGQFARAGFVVLRDAPTELVIGSVGRFWRPTSGVREIEAADFEGFAEPGYAKAVLDFRAEPSGAGTLLVTETRIQGTDEHARRTFRRYWRVIYPGSAAIRIAWLRAIRRRVERGQPVSSPSASARSS